LNILRPNFSPEFIFGALASAIVMTGCAGAEPAPKAPVQATEVQPAAAPHAGQASCSAGSCGAGKKEDKASTEAPKAADAAKPADASMGGASAPAPNAAAPAAPAAQPAAAATPAKAPSKAAGTVAPKKPATGGQAACGAGTCSAKK
jgi:hypothetical protein